MTTRLRVPRFHSRPLSLILICGLAAGLLAAPAPASSADAKRARLRTEKATRAADRWKAIAADVCQEARKCVADAVRASVDSAAPEWVDLAIGRRGFGGSALDDGVLTVSGAGLGFDATADEFHFVYKRVVGDVAIVSRLVAVHSNHPHAVAGLTLRSSLDASAEHFSVLGGALAPLQIHRRLAAHWTSLTTETLYAASGAWLKIERRGVVVDAFVSRDGVTWQFLASDLIEFDSAVYVGFAVASHNRGRLATAVFDSIAVRAIDTGVDAGPVTPAPAEPPASPPDEPVVDTPVSETPDPSLPPPSDGDPVDPTPVFGEPDPEPSPVVGEPEPPLVPSTPPPAPTETPTAPSQPPIETASPVPSPAVEPVPPQPAWNYVVFEPSPDHAQVDSYIVEVVLAGAVRSVVQRQDVGKPAVVDGEIRIDVGALLQLLPSGTYVVVVRATGGGYTSEGASSPEYAF